MSEKMQRKIGWMSVLGAALIFAPMSRAGLIGPGQSEFSASTSAPTGTTLAGPTLSTFSGGAGPSAFSGKLATTVIQESLANNPLGGVTFTFQISDDAGSQTSITRMTSNDFTNWLTNFGYANTGVHPASDDRNAGAAGWTFSSVGTNSNGLVDPNTSSDLLVIRTNAPTWQTQTANVIAGLTTTAATYGPLPEPASLSLLAVGSLALLRRRSAMSH